MYDFHLRLAPHALYLDAKCLNTVTINNEEAFARFLEVSNADS